MGPDSYYDTLGVSRDADDKEIRKAYRDLARKYHPDICKEPGAEERFKSINEAYSVLSDSEKRAQYDRMGHDAYSNASRGSYSGGGGYSGGFSADFSGFGDIFDTFFGGGGRQSSGPRPGADLLMKMRVTLEEAAFGTEKEVGLDHIEPCPACDGSGSETKKFTTCTTCGGSGQMRQMSQSIFGSFVRMSTCTACGGRGKIPESRCKACGGSGHRRGRETVKVRIPPGVDTGMRLRMEGYGDAGEYGAPGGDLYIEITVTPHRTFTRRGDDLETTVDITPAQATLGSEVEVKTIDGRTVILDIPAGVQYNTGLKIPGEGVRWQTKPGDMLVRVRIVVPKHLKEEERELYMRLLEMEGKKPSSKGSKKGKGFFQDVVDKVKETVK
ncbi:molecular chaperone DnaJ [Methanoculleus sp. UBA303]|jgi:molecular chaperone DnaJ|uniref:molecular chaperone DnaJ n=1 Tax=Methanoculleus sp. UBA303 TaxID=1915497 RepID=UPI0025E8C504|nr:molecular chaperone DnaJ [Methanoculleus sp. UBA303]MDD3932433.1 molecular chaperone DnaJ [Methanoculleus sp.]